MNRQQRRAHFTTWLFLAVALVSIFIIAQLARRDATNTPPKLPPPEQG